MMRHRCWFLSVIVCVGAAGCGDNMHNVMRDYYNLQHEIIDNMTPIVDDASAKRFNDAYKDRLKLKEEVNEARRDKIENNLFNQKDKDDNKALKESLIAGALKGEIQTLDARFRVMQNRLRRLIVKLCEEKMESAKAAQQSFTVNSKDVCPNLSELERGEPFVKSTNVFQPRSGGGMQMMMPNMQAGGGGPGPGGAAPPPGAPNLQPPGAQATVATSDPRANDNYFFVIECRHTGDAANPWQVSRSWRSGKTPVDRDAINKGLNIDILPLYSTQ